MISKSEQAANEFGRRLKNERQRLGLSQTNFAKIAGVSRPTQYLYESGSNIPGVNYLIAVMSAGADADYLLGRSKLPMESDLLQIRKSVLREIFQRMQLELFESQQDKNRPDLTARFESLCLFLAERQDDSIDWDALESATKIQSTR